jgi:transposase
MAVEEVPWGDGKRTLGKAYMLFLARWARRLSWKETRESFQGFFTTMGEAITSKIVFIRSDMWEPYLKVIRQKCSEAWHVLDRFPYRR